MTSRCSSRIWQQSLASRNRNKDSEADAARYRERQTELAQAMDGGRSAVVKYLRAQLHLQGQALGEVPPLPRPLTCEEVNDPPVELEEALYGEWEHRIRLGEASTPAFWAFCHLAWLEQGYLPDDLVGAFSTGQPGKRNPNLDNQTRAVLRGMSGLPHVRGNLSVFVDCQLARAWWRRRIALEAAEYAPSNQLNAMSAHKSLHRDGWWEKLAGLSIKQLTIISHPKVRSVIVAHIASNPGMKKDELAAVARRLARHGLTHSLEHVAWDELSAVAAG